jgi:hypothetical protein
MRRIWFCTAPVVSLSVLKSSFFKRLDDNPIEGNKPKKAFQVRLQAMKHTAIPR